MQVFRVTALAVLVSASIALPATAAITEGRTTNGRAYIAGGIGLSESDTMKSLADKHSLQLVVSSRSGAYLADMQVRILGANSEKILDIPLAAPWLLVDLAPGAYKVSVTHGGQTQERNVTIAAGRSERVSVQFDVPGDTAKSSEKGAGK